MFIFQDHELKGSTYFSETDADLWQFTSLEKKWMQDLINDVEGSMEVTLIFREKLYRDRDKVFCSLRPLLLQLADSIQPCQVQNELLIIIHSVLTFKQSRLEKSHNVMCKF